jgi:hypothetical protein
MGNGAHWLVLPSVNILDWEFRDFREFHLLFITDMYKTVSLQKITLQGKNWKLQLEYQYHSVSCKFKKV